MVTEYFNNGFDKADAKYYKELRRAGKTIKVIGKVMQVLVFIKRKAIMICLWIY